MSISIGRAGLDPAILDNPESFALSGGRVKLVGEIIGSTLAAAKAARDQVLGLNEHNPWEPVVPVCWSEDPSLDGYYRVLSASVPDVPLSLVNFTYRYEVEVERVPGWQQPRLELVSLGADRAYADDVSVTADGLVGISNNQTGISAATAATTRTGPGGQARVMVSAGAWYDATASYFLAPADRYHMAATIKVGGNIVTGRQVPTLGQLNSWEISNGLIKLAGNGSTYLATAYCPVAASKGTWATGQDVVFGRDSGGWGAYSTAVAVSVQRNSPEEVVLRLALSGTPAQLVDLRLRRGSHIVEVTYSGASVKYGLRFPSTTACTSIGGGECIHQTANNGDGNRLAFICDGASTNDTTEGRMQLTTAATVGSFGLAWEVGGAASSGNDTVANLRDQFFAAVGAVERVVAG